MGVEVGPGPREPGSTLGAGVADNPGAGLVEGPRQFSEPQRCRGSWMSSMGNFVVIGDLLIDADVLLGISSFSATLPVITLA